jgi:hypothetical protein
MAAEAARGAERMQRRVAHMHETLKITPAQEAAFQGFVTTMRDNAQAMRAAMQAAHGQMASMSALDMMRHRADMVNMRAQNMQKTVAAFETLYSQLSPEQKQIADSEAHKMAERMMHHRGGPGGMQHPPGPGPGGDAGQDGIE